MAVLDRGNAPRRIALAVAQVFDLIDDGYLGVSGQDEMGR